MRQQHRHSPGDVFPDAAYWICIVLAFACVLFLGMVGIYGGLR